MLEVSVKESKKEQSEFEELISEVAELPEKKQKEVSLIVYGFVAAARADRENAV